ncbi:hypothetical protein JIN77_08890 [Verrucomicrobiaceae bacterium R5-34]|nr:hypothetical protein [Verrucomicrobiaceae bacterium R5-34]
MMLFKFYGLIFVTGLYLGLILFAFYVYRAWQRKDLKRAGLLLALLLAQLYIMGGPLRVLPGSGILHERSQMKSLTGHAFRLNPTGKAVHTERSFLGDGTSMEMFVLPEHVAVAWQDPAQHLRSEFPQRGRYRSDWQVERWKATPPRVEEQAFVQFAEHACQSDSNRALFMSLLQEEGNYYSYFYNMHGTGTDANVGNIDFFILSPGRRLLVIINVNT